MVAKTRPDICVGGCGRRLVTKGTDIQDPENEVVHVGYGLCGGCRYAKKMEGQMRHRMPMPEFCQNKYCGVKLHHRREGGVTEKSSPYFGKGLCGRCYGALDRAAQAQIEILTGVRDKFIPRVRGGKPLRPKSRSLYSGKVYG